MKTETGSQAYIQYNPIHNPDNETMKGTAQAYSVIINTVKQMPNTENVNQRTQHAPPHLSEFLSVVGHIQIGFLCEPAGYKWKIDCIYKNVVLLDWHYIRWFHYTQTLTADSAV